MGNNKYEETPSGTEISTTDVKINVKQPKGLLLISNNKFLTRVWFLLSNPFRYLFIGKIRY